MKTHTHVGVYGLLIKEDKILLITKATGPYKGKLDLPGGTPEEYEKAVETLKREFKEETGLNITKEELIDFDSVKFIYNNKQEQILIHHVGIFYKIINYKGKIKENIKITKTNDDSKGAKFYNIKTLYKKELSKITILGLEKLGYKLK